MSSKQNDYPIVDGFIEMFCEWLKHRHDMQEIGRLDPQAYSSVASDLRVTPAELHELVRQGPHSADELPRLLHTLGIEEADLARSEPAVLRDMERVCAQCGSKSRCTNDIERGVAARTYGDYCPNTVTIESIGKRSE